MVKRRLSAILAADIVGYSRLIRADEEGTLAAVNALRQDLINPRIAAHHGRIVKLMGDGILAEFSSVVDAVRFAAEVQQAVAERNAELAQERRIEFRVGINLGDVVIDGDDIHGDGVNVAARLEGIAEPGGICISGSVYEQVRDRLDLAFTDMGEQTVKNIDRPVRAWQWQAEGVAAATSGKALAPSEKPSIAVLPFENMSGDPDQEYFSDGIAEDVITELSRFRSLFVIARNSSFTYKGQAIDFQRIATELGVRYVLEGSVRKAGNRIRVTAQLIDASTRKHIWAERYDRDLDDIFDVQDEITRTIVAAIEPELGGVERDRARRVPPDNLDAWGLYQRGLWHAYRFTPEDNAEALSLFQRSTEADPNFARAHAGLSLAYFSNAFLGYEGDRERYAELALDAAKRSVNLDDRDEAARWSLGRAYMIRAAHDRAIVELKTAIQLNPNYAQAHYSLGWALLLAGRSEEALPHLDAAERLSPHDPLLFAFCAARAQAYAHLGENERALEEARRSNRQPNAHENTQVVLVSILARTGQIEEARSELDIILANNPDYTVRDFAMSFPYQRSEDLGLIIEGLVAAGMSE